MHKSNPIIQLFFKTATADVLLLQWITVSDAPVFPLSFHNNWYFSDLAFTPRLLQLQASYTNGSSRTLTELVVPASHERHYRDNNCRSHVTSTTATAAKYTRTH